MNVKKFSAFLLSFSIFFAMGAFLVSSVSIVEAQGGGTNTPGQGGTNTPGQGGTNTPGQGGTDSPNMEIKFQNPFGQNTNLFDVLKSIVNNVLLPIGGVLAVLAFIYSGFLYVVAQGNESKIDEAHRALLYTSVGTAILLGAWVIVGVIEKTVNQLR